MTNAIELHDVVKTYRRGAETIRAVDGVSLTIREGEFVAIVGPSGSGKTTLLEMIGAVDKPTEGKVSIAGQDLAALSNGGLTRLRRDTIGFVFQQFFLLPTLTATENVELPAMFRGDRRARTRARELLDKVGLRGREDHRPSQLSGGQMQRVAIARAWINQPKILLADEPTGNLDSAAGRDVFELFRELNRSGMTVVVVTHNAEAAASSDRVIHIRDGRLILATPARGDRPKGVYSSRSADDQQ